MRIRFIVLAFACRLWIPVHAQTIDSTWTVFAGSEIDRAEAPAEVIRRLDDMQNWSDLYRHLLHSQYNYLRGLKAMHEHRGDWPDGPAPSAGENP